MKTEVDNQSHNGGKHNNVSFEQQTPIVVILDKRGRNLWISNDPFNEHGQAGTLIMDHVAEFEKKKILDLLATCILEGKTVEYDVIGNPPPACDVKGMVSWRVRMWPADYTNGVAAACCICYQLDPSYQEIKDDERILLKLLCQDHTLKEIAEKMLLSDSAIDSKMKQLKEKLRCHNIGGLVASAINGGILLN